MNPFLKWAGGKRWLTSKHPDWFSVEFNRYIEPFLGGGAVFFKLNPENAILADLNSELISTYNAIRTYPNEIEKKLKFHQARHCKDYYYYIRSMEPRNEVTKAAKFIYLNRTCFNGLYRVNIKGEFNVPKGSKTKVILDDDDFTAFSNRLKRAEIINCDFSAPLAEASESDFVFIDPPYTVKHNNNNFLKYNEKIFSWSDQKRLSRGAEKAASSGAKIIISNANHSCISELYSSTKWIKIEVQRASVLASSPKFRKVESELVISNFITAEGHFSGVRY